MWQQAAFFLARSRKGRQGRIWFVCFVLVLGLLSTCSFALVGLIVVFGGSGGSTFGMSTCTEGYTPSSQVPNPTVVRNTYTQGVQLKVSDKLMLAGFEAMLVESNGRMYASSNVPQSLTFPHDAVGSDHLSVNQFQQQFGPGFPWASTIEQAMDPAHAARAFFNEGIKLEKQGFSGTAGQLAQKIQRSAFPDRYDQRVTEAKALLNRTVAECSAVGSASGWVNPLPGQPLSSNYGERKHPVLGIWRFHNGVDFAANCGTNILAANSGTLSVSHPSGYGNLVSIEHPDGSVTEYGHVQAVIAPAGSVRSGQVIAQVGTEGTSTGCHLHFIVRPQGFSGTTIDPIEWYKNHGVRLG